MKKTCNQILEKEGFNAITIRKLNAGAVSVIYLAKTDRGHVVIKIKLVRSGGLNNEYAILDLLQKYNIASKPYAYGVMDNKPYLIEEYIPGRRLPWRNIKDADIVKLAQFFNILHAIPIKLLPKSIIRGKSLPLERLKYAKSLMHLNEEYAKIVRVAEKQLKKIKIRNELSLKHTDPNPHNFIVHKNKIVAIDWEESKIGHYATDIADLFIKGNFTQRQQKVFYNEYFHKNIEKIVYPFIITGTLGLIGWRLQRLESSKHEKMNSHLKFNPEKQKETLKKELINIRKILENANE